MLLEKGSCCAKETVNVGCLSVTKLSFEVWLLFKLQSSGDSPGPQKIILGKHTEVTLMKKQAAVFQDRMQTFKQSADNGLTIIQGSFVSIGQCFEQDSLAVFSSLMDSLATLTLLSLLTELFLEQLFTDEGYIILYNVYWYGTK